MTPEDIPRHPRRRATDKWTDEALDVKFDHYDSLLTALNPLPTEVARMTTRMESLVTRDALHDEMTDLASSIDANRRAIINAAVLLLVALIGAAATILAAVL